MNLKFPIAPLTLASALFLVGGATVSSGRTIWEGRNPARLYGQMSYMAAHCPGIEPESEDVVRVMYCIYNKQRGVNCPNAMLKGFARDVTIGAAEARVEFGSAPHDQACRAAQKRFGKGST